VNISLLSEEELREKEKKQRFLREREDKHLFAKLIFLAFSFNENELHQMFMNFYNEIDKDQSLTFDLSETKSCFEKYANDERLLGKKQI